jgi:outer membrane protein OmpU
MKKILLATTMLAAGVTAAAAEVSVSGASRMGVVYNGSDAQFYTRNRVYFTGSGETDGGLSFGFSVRNDQSGVGGTANGDSTVFISGAFGKLTMGDVSGAADAIVGQVSAVGFTSLGSTNEIGYLGNDKTAALYTYSTGDLTFGLGIGQTGTTAAAEIPGVAAVPGVSAAIPGASATTGAAYSVAVKYAMGDYSVALGYEDVKGDSQVSALGSATFGAATVKLKAANRQSALDNAYALSVDFTTGAATITAFATQNFDFAGTDSAGIGAAYDLGGGATVRGGIVDNGVDTVADLGLNLSF